VIWKLADAKNRFSEVVRMCMAQGPQRIERRGADAVYVVSEGDYRRLKGDKPSLVEFLMSGPDWSELDLERKQDSMRDVDL
jgi:prevent-host-death family protein